MEAKGEAEAVEPAGKEEAAESVKQRGNEHFVSKRFAEAIECYSRAIEISSPNHVLFGNRSAAHGGLGAWELAAADARTSIELDPGYTKGFYRLAQALIEMGDVAEAESAIEDGLRIDPANREMVALRRKATSDDSNGSGQNKGGRLTAGGKTPMRKAAGRLGLGGAGLYDDKEPPDRHEETGETGRLKGLFSTLRESVAPSGGKSGSRHELDGMFTKLMEPEQFRRIALSRLSEEERRRAPCSLQELLRMPVYASALEKALPRVVSRADSVLEGVKRRGLEQGDIMDAATEEVLKPQVLQEAFAREVIGVITAVQATARAQAVLDQGRLASPRCEEASWDQLQDTTVTDLLRRGKGFSIQDSFLGDEWVSPLLEDSARFSTAGRLHPLGLEPEHGEMAWVEAGQLEYDYPALHELIVNLHALTFELNLKGPGLGLSRPFQGSTMLLRLTEGCRVPVRLDSVAGGVETGHRVSAVYFIGRTGENPAGDDVTAGRQEQDPAEGGPRTSRDVASAGGQLVLQNIEAVAAPVADGEVSSPRIANRGGGGGSGSTAGSERLREGAKNGNPEDSGSGSRTDGRDEAMGSTRQLDSPGARTTEAFAPPQQRGAVVEPTADRLVLFRSDRVSTQTLEVSGRGHEQYAVLFWMHAAKEEVGGVGAAAAAEGSEGGVVQS
ncbi:unnamed protein product [Scytosiphon promiscuus]